MTVVSDFQQSYVGLFTFTPHIYVIVEFERIICIILTFAFEEGFMNIKYKRQINKLRKKECYRSDKINYQNFNNYF